MHHAVLQYIEAKDPLARLFNSYQQSLSLLEHMVMPRDGMRAYQRARDENQLDPDRPDTMLKQAKLFYELATLSLSLNGIHRCVVGAISLLETFFTTYQGDLYRYAVANRIASIEQYGSEDDSDWYREDETNEQEWKIAYKDDSQSLTYYTLHHELGAFFHGYESKGEYIGSSGPKDFAVYTQVVVNQSEASLRRVTDDSDFVVGQLSPEGHLKPLSLADQIENELNYDLRNARMVESFVQVLNLGLQAAKYYERLSSDAVSDYRTLLNTLQAMLATAITPS